MASVRCPSASVLLAVLIPHCTAIYGRKRSVFAAKTVVNVAVTACVSNDPGLFILDLIHWQKVYLSTFNPFEIMTSIHAFVQQYHNEVISRSELSVTNHVLTINSSPYVGRMHEIDWSRRNMIFERSVLVRNWRPTVADSGSAFLLTCATLASFLSGRYLVGTPNSEIDLPIVQLEWYIAPMSVVHVSDTCVYTKTRWWYM
jgi:hypothetical protein